MITITLNNNSEKKQKKIYGGVRPEAIYIGLGILIFCIIIGIGFWYGKKDPKFNTKFITTFAGNFGLPAIIF